MKEKYNLARNIYLPVHTIDLQRWGQEYAKKNNFKFKSSNRWLQTFKRENRITNRKAVKILSLKEIKEETNILKSITDFKSEYNNKTNNYTDE